ncbi:7966_t:CDS:2, partial [Acaulospora colombiana]
AEDGSCWYVLRDHRYWLERGFIATRARRPYDGKAEWVASVLEFDVGRGTVSTPGVRSGEHAFWNLVSLTSRVANFQSGPYTLHAGPARTRSALKPFWMLEMLVALYPGQLSTFWAHAPGKNEKPVWATNREWANNMGNNVPILDEGTFMMNTLSNRYLLTPNEME